MRSDREKLCGLLDVPTQGPLYLYNLTHPLTNQCLLPLLIQHLEPNMIQQCLKVFKENIEAEIDLWRVASKESVMKMWGWVSVRVQVSLKTLLNARSRLDDQAYGSDKVGIRMIRAYQENEIAFLQSMQLQIKERLDLESKNN